MSGETFKQRIERDLRETFEQMRGPEMSFEKLREEYHRKCDEVVTLREKISQMETNAIENAMNAGSWANARERKHLEASLAAERENSQKARDERDAALVKLNEIRNHLLTLSPHTGVKVAKMLRLIGEPLIPGGAAATRST